MRLQDWFDRADELGAKGEYFEAHEELEAGWMKAQGAEKVLLQGLIQLAAGLHRLRKNPEKTDGGVYLLERGLQKLEKSAALVDAASLQRLKSSIEKAISTRRAPPAFTFGLRAR